MWSDSFAYRDAASLGMEAVCAGRCQPWDLNRQLRMVLYTISSHLGSPVNCRPHYHFCFASVAIPGIRPLHRNSQGVLPCFSKIVLTGAPPNLILSLGLFTAAGVSMCPSGMLLALSRDYTLS